MSDGEPGTHSTGELLEAPEAVAAAWDRELPGVPTRSIAVVWLAKQVAAELRSRRDDALRELDLDAATLDLLSTLRRAGHPYALTTRQLARRCLVSPGAISQRVARAEADGLVERRTIEGRQVEVSLTLSGNAVVERGAGHVLRVDDELTDGLTDDELANLAGLLARWLRSARDARPAERGPAERERHD